MEKIIEGTRCSGLPWATEQRDVMIIGCGGIGSWLCLSLARIGMHITIFDGDSVDETNVKGGQLYKLINVGDSKVDAIYTTCREFGCTGVIDGIAEMYNKEMGMEDICIMGVDNMKARREVYDAWREHVRGELANPQVIPNRITDFLFIDGRMIGELYEVFTIQGNNEEQMAEYEEKWLFSDEEVEALDCTMKQTTFMGMGIASAITATLCNWLTNRKEGMEIRDIPFHERVFSPIKEYKIEETQILA